MRFGQALTDCLLGTVLGNSAATKTGHSLGGFDKGLSSQISGGWKSKRRLQMMWFMARALPGLRMAALSLPPLRMERASKL